MPGCRRRPQRNDRCVGQREEQCTSTRAEASGKGRAEPRHRGVNGERSHKTVWGNGAGASHAKDDKPAAFLPLRDRTDRLRAQCTGPIAGPGTAPQSVPGIARIKPAQTRRPAGVMVVGPRARGDGPPRARYRLLPCSSPLPRTVTVNHMPPIPGPTHGALGSEHTSTNCQIGYSHIYVQEHIDLLTPSLSQREETTAPAQCAKA